MKRRVARRRRPTVATRDERIRYAAAMVNRLTGPWQAVRDLNDLLGQSGRTIRARVQQLTRDFPPFWRAVNALQAFTVGDGIRVMPQPLGPDGTVDPVLAQVIESAWLRWCDEADVSKQLHFYELQGLVDRQESEDGEALPVFVQPAGRGRFPLALQMVEPERLSAMGRPGSPLHDLKLGIEYHKITGERVAYHLEVEGGRVEPVAASRVLHAYNVLRPGQLRGVSPFVSAVLLAGDLREYADASLDRAKMSARWLAFITTEDATGYQAARGAEDREGKRVEDLEHAAIEYLEPGERITLAQDAAPASNFEAFCNYLLRLVAVSVDLPVEILTGDYRKLNYTTLRGSRMDFAKSLKLRQFRRIERFCKPVYQRWMDRAVLSGTLRLPGYDVDPWRYRRASWIAPSLPPADPLKAAQADELRLGQLTMSPQEVMLARGVDPDRVLDEWAVWQQKLEARGLRVTPTEMGKALVNAAAAAPQNQETGAEGLEGDLLQ